MPAATVTYTYPVAGTVPPTAVQSSRVPTVTGYVDWAGGGGVTALFTHNLGLATAPGFAGRLPAVSQGFPEVILHVSADDAVNLSLNQEFGAQPVDGNVLQL